MSIISVKAFLATAVALSFFDQAHGQHYQPTYHQQYTTTPSYHEYTTTPAYHKSYSPSHNNYGHSRYHKRDTYGDKSYSSGDYGGNNMFEDNSYFVDGSLYWVPTRLTEYVIDLKGKDGGTYEPNQPWKADCNGYSYGYKFGWITAIWDDYDFKDLDYLKCAGPKDYDDKYGGTYKLDTYDAKVIEFPPFKHDYKPAYKPNECPKGYILTALWAGDYEFKQIKYGKCVKLVQGLVDYMTCDNIPTIYEKQGGTYEAYKPWKLEVPQEWAMVGLKKGDYDKIEFIRACKLIPPHPAYGNSYGKDSYGKDSYSKDGYSKPSY